MSRRRAKPKTRAVEPAAAGREGSNSRGWRSGLAGGLLLAALTLVAYANSFSADWHLDDQSNIIQNPYIRITSLRPSALLSAMIQDGKQNRPVSNLSFAVNYYFSGERVFSYHVVNWCWHLLAVWAVFAWLRRTLRLAGLPEESRGPGALLAAAFFAVHPLQTQAVTYIVQRQALMASGLMLLSLLAYSVGREATSSRRRVLGYGGAMLAWLLALGAKETALVTPALVLLDEICIFQRGSLAFLRRRTSKMALAVIVPLAAVLGLLYARPAVWNLLMHYYPRLEFTPGQRVLTEARVLVHYLGLLLWPAPAVLNLEHDPSISTSLFHPWTTLPAVLFWLGLAAAGLRFLRSRPLFSFAVFWYLGNLALESSFLPLDLMFEHRVYLAALAVLTPMAVMPWVGLVRFPRLRLLLLICLLGLLTVNTVLRNQVWQSDLRLYRDCVRKSPFQSRSRVNLGQAYLNAGQNQRAQREYEKSFRFGPQTAEAYNGLAEAALKEGRIEQAQELFQTSLQIRPNADALIGLGNVHYYRGEYEPAIEFFSRAIELERDYPEAFNDRANCYRRLNRLPEAIRDYTRAIELNPRYAEAYNNRGNAYADQGLGEPAAEDYSQALRLKPDYAEAYYNRGNLFAHQGQYDAALSDYQQALHLKPDFVEVYISEGLVWRMKGRRDRALADFSRALELKPDQIQALKNRALLYQELGEEARAKEDWEKLRRLTSP